MAEREDMKPAIVTDWKHEEDIPIQILFFEYTHVVRGKIFLNNLFKGRKEKLRVERR